MMLLTGNKSVWSQDANKCGIKNFAQRETIPQASKWRNSHTKTSSSAGFLSFGIVYHLHSLQYSTVINIQQLDTVGRLRCKLFLTRLFLVQVVYMACHIWRHSLECCNCYSSTALNVFDLSYYVTYVLRLTFCKTQPVMSVINKMWGVFLSVHCSGCVFFWAYRVDSAKSSSNQTFTVSLYHVWLFVAGPRWHSCPNHSVIVSCVIVCSWTPMTLLSQSQCHCIMCDCL